MSEREELDREVQLMIEQDLARDAEREREGDLLRDEVREEECREEQSRWEREGHGPDYLPGYWRGYAEWVLRELARRDS